MANPGFSEKLFQRLEGVTTTDTMTFEGTINKSGLLLAFAIAGAAVGWQAESMGLAMILLLVNLVLAFAIIWGPHRAQYLSQVYALGEGYILGAISAIYAVQYPGIVSNAMFLTIGVLGVMLVLYRFRIITVSDKFRSILMAATMAVALTYFVSMIMSLFGSSVPMIHQASPIGIAFSVVVVLIAAFNLLLDFDMIESLQSRGAPKYMEWYAGFALLLTIVWLYLEILRLLSKLSKK